MEPPHPVQLFALGENNKITLYKKALHILKDPSIKNKKVCIISIAGAFRQGKSFLLNFLLRYLNNLKLNKPTENWLKNESEAISGFSWKPGTERDTIGILMWSEIFLTKLSNGEEVAIILLDTQGTFDHETTMTQCTSIFALSVLISSIQIYNIKNNIDMTHLTNLQLFAEYGKIISDKNEEPTQKLLFLVRDWSYPYDYAYGGRDGQKTLDSIFEKYKTSGQKELISVQKSITENFGEVGCFFLPRPEAAVTSQKNFKGEIKDIGEEFLQYVQELVLKLLKPDNLVKKTFNNEEITVEDLSVLIETFSEYFQNEQQLDVTDPHTMMCKRFYDKRIEQFLETYRKLMENCKSKENYIIIKKYILETFEKKQLGDQEMKRKYSEGLMKKMDEIYLCDFQSIIDPDFMQKFAAFMGKIGENFSNFFENIPTDFTELNNNFLLYLITVWNRIFHPNNLALTQSGSNT